MKISVNAYVENNMDFRGDRANSKKKTHKPSLDPPPQLGIFKFFDVK